MEATGGRLRLALDHNFPTPILEAVRPWVREAELVPVRAIHGGMEELDDDELVVSLASRGWDGLVTCDFRMLKNPRVLAAVMQTRFRVVAIESAGDDPLMATGALLLELPGVTRRLRPGVAQVFRLRPRAPRPEDPWKLLTDLANRRGESTKALFDTVMLSVGEREDPLKG